jgi:hypothetical protein
LPRVKEDNIANWDKVATNDQTNPFKPRRIEALTREFGDELLVYDVERHRAHCLNKTAAAVWLECDGCVSVTEIAKKLDGALQASGDDGLVRLALAKLGRAGLLETSEGVLDRKGSLSRRNALKRIKMAAIAAVPIVTTMLAPTPASAASCLPALKGCHSNAQCCSGACVAFVCL